jgi:hypothetical protein
MATWKNLDITDRYSVSEEGNIRNNKTGKILKNTPSTSGYARVSIKVENKKLSKIIFPHREVAKLFIQNTENKPQVNHKDEDKMNPKVDNLEWVTPMENTRHAIDNGLFDPIEHSKKAVAASLPSISIRIVVCCDGKQCKEYPSIASYAREIGRSITDTKRKLDKGVKINGCSLTRK